MKKWKMAIVGAGNIAGKMAATIREMETVESYAVASRDLERARQFAKKYGFKKVYGSYIEMLQNEKVDLVYIATPHSHHYEHMKLCINYEKNILCEKPFTVNGRQAQEIFQLAGKKGLFVGEAMWIRYMPMADTIRKLILDGVIGKVSLLTANLGYVLSEVPRMKKPELAGGALLDLGCYPLHFASMMLGDEVERIQSFAQMTPEGVDAQNIMLLSYTGNIMAQLNSTMTAQSDRQGIIYGDKGFLVVENINNFESVTVYNEDYKVIEKYCAPDQITGFEYQVEAAFQAIGKGEKECLQLPHKEILRVIYMMDEMRQAWGMKYPFE